MVKSKRQQRSQHFKAKAVEGARDQVLNAHLFKLAVGGFNGEATVLQEPKLVRGILPCQASMAFGNEVDRARSQSQRFGGLADVSTFDAGMFSAGASMITIVTLLEVPLEIRFFHPSAYDALGQTDLALSDYTNAIRQMPSYSNAYWGLGDLYFEAGENGKALANYQMYLACETTADAQVRI